MNTPHNPLGKVYTPAELQRIADVLERFPEVWVISDEVYEHLVYGGKEFRSIGTYGDLWRRCGMISSAGKLFSVTGWKTGWVIGGEELIKKLTLVKQWTTFTSNTPCQYAICKALAIAEQPYQGFPTYYAWLHNEYDRKRVRLMKILATCQIAEFEPLEPEGGFFVIARIKSARGLSAASLENSSLDYALARWLTVEHRVTAIPCSSFFTTANKQIGQTFLRFALCKTDEDYDIAAQRLQCPP
jgi:aspartate/methionine/tyrosine aminotransferase